MSAGISSLYRLVESTGARPPASSGERKLAHLVSERLDDLNVPQTILHFRTVRGVSSIYLIPFLGLILSVLIAALFPLVGLLIATASAVVAVLEATTRPIASRLLRLGSSQNVVGLIPPKPPEGERTGPPRRRVVLSTHLDTPRLGWLDYPQITPFVHWFTIATLAGIVGVPVLLAVNLFVDGPIPIVGAALFSLIIVAATILLLQRDISGVEEEGMRSNGSGVAVALAIVDELRRYPPLDIETLVLFTGASQAGAAGMIDFLTENRFNPTTTFFINIESVEHSPVCFTRSEGPLLALQSSPSMNQIAGDIALTNPQRLMRPIVHRGRSTGQYAALIRGYQAITIMSHPDPRETGVSAPDEPDGGSENDSDESEPLDSEALESAYILAHGIIRQLDEESVIDDSSSQETTSS